jgi:hypothetical protein
MSTKPLRQPPTAPYTYTKHATPITDQQIAQACYNAGFRGEALKTAIAVALAESHTGNGVGNATALNDHGEFSVGMFQINVNGYLASRLQKWGFSTWTDLWDPEKNAKAAYQISGHGKHFGAWSVYKHGSYLKYMSRANAAAATVNSTAPTGGTTQRGTPVPNAVVGPSIYPGSSISLRGSGLEYIIAILGTMGVVFFIYKQKEAANGNR